MTAKRKPKMQEAFVFDGRYVESHGFVVTVPKGRSKAHVRIDEFIDLDGDGETTDAERFARCELPRAVWDAVEPRASRLLRSRAESAGREAAGFTPGENVLDLTLGKELTLLAWAVEDQSRPDARTETALASWEALAPEERLWLYDRAAASAERRDNVKLLRAEGYDRKAYDRSWRKAVKTALGERATLADAEEGTKDDEMESE